MERSSKARALSSPHVNSAEPRRRGARTKKPIKTEEIDNSDIDAKTFEEAEASIKALVEEAEPKLINKSDGTSEINGHTNGVIESDESFTEFEFLETEGDVTDDIKEEEEIDPESVLDKIFDAAKSGNSADFSRLLFTKEKSGTADEVKPCDLDSKANSNDTTDPNEAFVEQLISKGNSRSKKRKTENNPSVSGKVKKVAVNTKRTVDFKDVKNTAPTAATPVNDPKAIPQVGLIDYSVLTSALTKTLNENLNGGENDVKIVIFCNNKPIQSFSLRNNINEVAAKIEETGAETLNTDTVPKSTSETSNTSSDKPEEGVGGTKETKSPNVNEGKAPAHSPSKPVRGFKRLSNGKKKDVNTSTFLRIKGSAVSALNQTKKLSPDSNSVDVDSDEDSDKLVINTDDTNDNGKETDTSKNDILVNNVPQFQCELCLKNFNLRRTLNRHKLRVHTVKYQQIFPKPTDELCGNVDAAEPSKPEASAEQAETSKDAGVDGAEVSADCIERDQEETAIPSVVTQLEEVDIAKVKTEPTEEGEKDESINYIQSILSKGPLYDILQSKNTSHSTKVSTLRNVIQQVEKAKSSQRLHLPVDTNGEIQPVFVCEHCGKYYRSRKTLKDHFMRAHAKTLGDEPLYLYIAGNKYQCTVCFKYFHSSSDLLAHTKTHTGELLSPCTICGKVYSSVHVLRRHIDNVHAEVRPRPYRCQLCDYAACNKWHLKEHHRRHTGEQPFRCPICFKLFSHQGTMNRHCKTVHRFDSSSLSREQLRLQHGLSSLTVSSLQLTGSELTLADLTTGDLTATPLLEAQSVLQSIPLLTSSDTLSTSTDLASTQIAELAAHQSAELAANQSAAQKEEQTTDTSASETALEQETLEDNVLEVDMSIVKTEPVELF